MPMRKVSTLINSTSRINSQYDFIPSEMSPSETTVNKILQFAAAYKVEKVTENDIIGFILN
ncbi:MAG TPA: hypothetical protein PKH58_09355 [Paludibacteraceae bacterium]|nr:hypothetical protein [Paludibacteraceae bacterium]